MSDPVSKTDIEDVLSSIRRLVSEDNRIGPRRVVSRERIAQDKLVLTPALRVADDEPSEGENESWIDEITALRDESGWSEIQFERGRADEIAAPDGGGDVEAGPAPADRDAPAIATEPEIAEASESDQADAGELPQSGADTDVENEPWRDPQATLFASAREAGYDGGAETPEDNDVIESAHGGAAEEFRPRLHLDMVEREASDDSKHAESADESADDPRGETDWEADEGAGISVESVSDDIIEPAEEGFGDGEASDEDYERRTESLTAKIKALEEAIGRSHERFEPDGPGEDDYAGTPVRPIEWEDAGNRRRSSPVGVIRGVFERGTIAAQPDGSPERDDHDGDGRASGGGAEAPGEDIRGMFRHEPPNGPATSGSDQPVSVLDDETVLDEESLRELVADIVRQELQGALGERITRNVRKLVRREIHRALAAKELE